MRKLTRSYLLITFGSAIQGAAMALFLFPHWIPSGGAGGIAVLLNFWFSMPLSIALWLVNFSLLVAAINWLGTASTIGTMFAITATSLAVHLCSIDGVIPYSGKWLDLLIGSTLLGIGIGILLRQGVSNGGMGVIALIIAKYKKIPPGKPLLVLNGFVFILTASIIDWEIVIQAIICQWISTRMVDIIFNLHPPSVFPYTVSWRKRK